MNWDRWHQPIHVRSFCDRIRMVCLYVGKSLHIGCQHGIIISRCDLNANQREWQSSIIKLACVCFSMLQIVSTELCNWIKTKKKDKMEKSGFWKVKHRKCHESFFHEVASTSRIINISRSNRIICHAVWIAACGRYQSCFTTEEISLENSESSTRWRHYLVNKLKKNRMGQRTGFCDLCHHSSASLCIAVNK